MITPGNILLFLLLLNATLLSAQYLMYTEPKPVRVQKDSIFRALNNHREGLGLSRLERSKWMGFWSQRHTRKAGRKHVHSKALRNGTAEVICFNGGNCLESWRKSYGHNLALTAPKATKMGVGVSKLGSVVVRFRYD